MLRGSRAASIRSSQRPHNSVGVGLLEISEAFSHGASVPKRGAPGRGDGCLSASLSVTAEQMDVGDASLYAGKPSDLDGL